METRSHRSDSQPDRYTVRSLGEGEDDVDEIVINELLIEDDDSDETQMHAFAASPFRFSASASLYPARLLPSTRLAFVDDDTVDVAASTRSLLEQYLDYREENGRRYCGDYYMPNDDWEQTRMYLNHQVFLQMMQGKATTVPLNNPTKIIDIGCGTGDWVCQIGELYPDCDVVGKDISAIQPSNPPHNVFFEIEDAEEPWLQTPDSVDLVHFREMVGAFRDWRFIYEQAYECLKPGGYIEVQEIDDGGGTWGYIAEVFPPDSYIHQAGLDLREASIRSGRPLGIQHLSPELFAEAGFVDIKRTYIEIPVDLDSGDAGKIWLVSCIDCIEAFSLRLLTKYMGYDPIECQKICERIACDMATVAHDPEKARLMRARVRIMTGRKPEHPVHKSSSDRTPVSGMEDRVSLTNASMRVLLINQQAAQYASQAGDNEGDDYDDQDDGSRTRRGSMAETVSSVKVPAEIPTTRILVPPPPLEMQQHNAPEPVKPPMAPPISCESIRPPTAPPISSTASAIRAQPSSWSLRNPQEQLKESPPPLSEGWSPNFPLPYMASKPSNPATWSSTSLSTVSSLSTVAQKGEGSPTPSNTSGSGLGSGSGSKFEKVTGFFRRL